MRGVRVLFAYLLHKGHGLSLALRVLHLTYESRLLVNVFRLAVTGGDDVVRHRNTPFLDHIIVLYHTRLDKRMKTFYQQENTRLTNAQGRGILQPQLVNYSSN